MGCRSQMTGRAAIAIAIGILFITLDASAQCPAGLLDLGEVSATTPPGRYQEVKVTRELAIPEGIQIDDSYHELSIQAASDGAASEMRAAQIPAGFQLLPGGQGGGAWWSIDHPELKQVAGLGKEPDHFVFRIDLYANSGGRAPVSASPDGSPAPPSVRVRVCVRTRS